MTSDLMSLWHVGVLVKDISEAVKFYELIPECGPWSINEITFTSDEVIVGSPMTVKIAMSKVGDILVELIQPVSSGSYQELTINKRGELIHHLAYVCSDFDTVVKKLLDEGNILAWSGEKDGTKIAFIESTTGAMIFELVSQLPTV